MVTRKVSAAKHQAFLELLATSASPTLAAEAAGLDRSNVYRARQRHPEFAAAWDAAIDVAIDSVVGALVQRAIEKDTPAALFLLKHHRPALYGDHPQNPATTSQVLVYLPPRTPLDE